MAIKNQDDVKNFEVDIKEARDYTKTKFNDLKTILDDYKTKQDSTHEQVVKLTQQVENQKDAIDDNNELLRQLLEKTK